LKKVVQRLAALYEHLLEAGDGPLQHLDRAIARLTRQDNNLLAVSPVGFRAFVNVEEVREGDLVVTDSGMSTAVRA